MNSIPQTERCLLTTGCGDSDVLKKPPFPDRIADSELRSGTARLLVTVGWRSRGWRTKRQQERADSRGRPQLVVLQQPAQRLMTDNVLQSEVLYRRRRRQTRIDGYIPEPLMRPKLVIIVLARSPPVLTLLKPGAKRDEIDGLERAVLASHGKCRWQSRLDFRGKMLSLLLAGDLPAIVSWRESDHLLETP
jgi:hypothetical protein